MSALVAAIECCIRCTINVKHGHHQLMNVQFITCYATATKTMGHVLKREELQQGAQQVVLRRAWL